MVAAFASGEVFALRSSNGNEIWTEALSRASRNNALSEIRDVAGRPVIYRGDVFAVSHSGVFTATDLRTGQARWSLPVIGVTSPLPVGDVVYVVSKAGQLICASRETGQVYWIRELNSGLNKKQLKKEKKHPTLWSTPLLASNHLIVASSKGEALALDPKTGATTKTIKIGTPVLMGPMAMDGMVYFVDRRRQAGGDPLRTPPSTSARLGVPVPERSESYAVETRHCRPTQCRQVHAVQSTGGPQARHRR